MHQKGQQLSDGDYLLFGMKGSEAKIESVSQEDASIKITTPFDGAILDSFGLGYKIRFLPKNGFMMVRQSDILPLFRYSRGRIDTSTLNQLEEALGFLFVITEIPGSSFIPQYIPFQHLDVLTGHSETD